MSTRGERALFAASALTNVGDWLTYVAVASLAATSAAAAPSLALVVLGQTLPRAALSPLAGWLVDRVERTRAYAAAEVARGLVVLVMAYAAARADGGAVLVLHAVRGGLGAVSDTALRAAVPGVVAVDRLERVNQRLGVLWSVVFVVGVAAGGLVVSRAGIGAAFLADAGSFFLAAAVALALPLVPPRTAATRTGGRGAFPPAALFRAPLAFAHGAAFVLVTPSPSSATGVALGLSLVHGARAFGNAFGATLATRARSALVFTPVGLVGVALAVTHEPASALGLLGAVLWGAGMGALYTSVTTTLQRDVEGAFLGAALARDALVFTLAWATGACAAGFLPTSRSVTLVVMALVVLVTFAATAALDHRARTRSAS